MSFITRAKDRLLFSHVDDRGNFLEVYEDRSSQSLGYVGYLNGERKTAAARPDLCLRGLVRASNGRASSRLEQALESVLKPALVH